VVLGGLALAGADRPRWGVEGGRIGAYCLGGREGGKVGCDVGIFFFQVLDWLLNHRHQWVESESEEDLGILLVPRR